MNRTLPALLIVAALAGCSSPQGDQVDSEQGDVVAGQAWQLQAQRTLGFYAGVQAAGLRVMPAEEGYCRLLNLDVPTGANWLNLTFVSKPHTVENGSYGPLGISARSESQNQWVGYPDESKPEQSYLDETKLLSVPDPEPGTWDIWTFTTGPALNAKGNLTIDVQGVSAAVPDGLEIDLWDSFTKPCDDSP